MKTSSEAIQRICTAVPLAGITVASTFYCSNTHFVVVDTLLMLLIGWEWVQLLGYSCAWCLGYIIILTLVASLTKVYLSLQWIIAFSVCMAVSLIVKTLALVNWKKAMDCPALLLANLGGAYLILNWNMLLFLKRKSPLYLGVGFLIIALTDIAAYLVGKVFGTHRLPASINSHKTWEGCLAGLISPSILILLLSQFVYIPLVVSLKGMAVMLLTSLTAIAGDLFESAIKRQRGVKDSGTGLPGHGGWLDRYDSLVCAVPVFAVGLFTCLSF